MSLNEQQRKDLVSLYWNKSLATWDEYELCEKAEKWNVAANRMYYALYHAICTLKEIILDFRQGALALHKRIEELIS